jgi:hypothetical protein
MLHLDHIAVSAGTLAEGAAWVEAALGVPLEPGGQHPYMATHNRLLGLGDLYLEVIAADPAQPAPAWPRWFDLDHFVGAPRLTNWIARCDDLDAEVAAAPPGVGRPVSLARGAYRWRMAVPKDGILPLGGLQPALIQWQGPAHPATALPDRGVRLRRLELTLPEAPALRAALKGRLDDPRLAISDGATASLRAEFDTPQGMRAL